MLLLFGAVAPRTAHADPKKDIQQKIKEAMENYDLLEYEEARKLLNQALTIAKQKKLENDPVVAQVHLRLAIVYKAGLNDDESAKLSFLSAVQIDPKITIDAAYKTPELQKMLDEAKKEATSGGGGGVDTGGGGGSVDTGGGGDDVDCKSVTGLQHTIVDTAKGGASLHLDAYLGKDVVPTKVAIMYRSKGATDFTEIKMTKSGDCHYAGEIPGDAMAGDLVHYYVAAFNKNGKVIASKGSSGSPNIVEVSAPAGGGGGGGGGGAMPGDDEDPLHGGGHKATPVHTAVVDDSASSSSSSSSDGNVSGGVVVGGKSPKVFITVAGGTGAGFVTGETEQQGNKVECCFAPDLAHVFGEIGYYVNSTTAIGIGVRVGFPVGANIPDHATAAPAGLLRIHHSFGENGNGLMVVGQAGGGIIRNTIKLTDAPSDMNMDIAAMGPLIVGAGAGYVAPLGGAVKLDAEVNALAGIPVVTQIGLSKLNFGVEFDFSLGLMVGF
ncbi:MAG TPA: tetratricopeptide repeat protein [Kofleriaceae bacterium]|nr:tetratricopeptide repeat protein [Kofleriaceae bacterium]